MTRLDTITQQLWANQSSCLSLNWLTLKLGRKLFRGFKSPQPGEATRFFIFIFRVPTLLWVCFFLVCVCVCCVHAFLQPPSLPSFPSWFCLCALRFLSATCFASDSSYFLGSLTGREDKLYQDPPPPHAHTMHIICNNRHAHVHIQLHTHIHVNASVHLCKCTPLQANVCTFSFFLKIISYSQSRERQPPASGWCVLLCSTLTVAGLALKALRTHNSGPKI